MEALVYLVIIIAAWWLLNRLGVLDVGTALVTDSGVMATNASTVARVKSDVKRDKYLSNEKVDLQQRVRAELNLKKHLKYSSMSIDDLEAEMAKMTTTN